MFVRLIIWLLHSRYLSTRERMLLSGEVMHSVGAIPLHDIITIDERQQLLVRGKPLEYEVAMQLRNSAKLALESSARTLAHEQTAFSAVAMGVFNVTTPEQMLFARGALWFAQQETVLLKTLAGETQDPTL